MNYQQILLRLLRQAKSGLEVDTWKTQGAVLAGQVGDYCKCVYLSDAYPREEQAYRVEAVQAIGDLVIQCQISCALLGVDFDQTVENAFRVFTNRMRDVLRQKTVNP